MSEGSRDVRLFLEDILESIDYIIDDTANLTREEFETNRLIQDVVIRRLEIIGEAVRHLSTEFRLKYPTIAWPQIAGMRDILIHEYFGVDLDIVWDTVRNAIPVFKVEIEAILRQY